MGFFRSFWVPADQIVGRLRAVRTRQAPLARVTERIPHRAVRVDVEGVCSRNEVGPVEDERVHPFRVTNREALREERAVGVSVEVDLVDLEIIEDRREVVRRERRAVDIRGLGELASALADRLGVVVLVGLQRLTEDRLRTSGSAVVDQQEAAAVEHRLEEIEVVVAARGGCVSGPPSTATMVPSDGLERSLRGWSS